MQATGYFFEWCAPPWSPDHDPVALRARIVEHIDRGWPILGFGARQDLSVIYGYEAGGERVLLSDYWATDDPSVMATADAQEIGMFLERIAAQAPRPSLCASRPRIGAEAMGRRGHRPRSQHRRHVLLRPSGLRTLDRRSRASRHAQRRPAGQPLLPLELDVQLAVPESQGACRPVPARQRRAPSTCVTTGTRGSRGSLRPHVRPSRRVGPCRSRGSASSSSNRSSHGRPAVREAEIALLRDLLDLDTGGNRPTSRRRLAESSGLSKPFPRRHRHRGKGCPRR